MSSFIFSSVTTLIFLMAILCGCSAQTLRNPEVLKVDSSRSLVRTLDRGFSGDSDSLGTSGKR